MDSVLVLWAGSNLKVKTIREFEDLILFTNNENIKIDFFIIKKCDIDGIIISKLEKKLIEYGYKKLYGEGIHTLNADILLVDFNRYIFLYINEQYLISYLRVVINVSEINDTLAIELDDLHAFHYLKMIIGEKI